MKNLYGAIVLLLLSVCAPISAMGKQEVGSDQNDINSVILSPRSIRAASILAQLCTAGVMDGSQKVSKKRVPKALFKKNTCQPKVSQIKKRPYVCKSQGCDKSYLTSSTLRRHIEAKHTSEQRHVCDQCGARFGYDNSLTIHIAREHNGQMYACDYQGCGQKFPLRATLNHHRRTKHSL